MNNGITYLTAQGLEKLKKEFKYLKEEKRREISKRIEEAKEYGDLSENAEYTEAKNEQAQIEARIIELENLIKSSHVISSQQKGDVVQIGSKIRVRLNGAEEKIYEIVGSEEADPFNGKISNESPLGQAFLGCKVDEVIDIVVPKGKIKCQILEIL
jgi:transcription elongation factor GreA